MKIITVLGTRPEFIRLSLIIKKMDDYFGKDHISVDTGQNFTYELNAIFQKELGVRKPNYSLGVRSYDVFDRIGQMLKGLGKVFDKEEPDFLLVLGDTYTSFSAAFVARHFRKKNMKGIKVFHLEAGNRSFDKRVPEETNRTIIDNISNYNLAYTERSKENLIKNGITRNVFVMGNPIKEVMEFFAPQIEKSKILKTLKLKKKDYILVTLHREENVTQENSLKNVISALNELNIKYKKKIIFSTHPKTKDMLKKFKVKANKDIIFSEPFGFLDFHKLMDNAFLVMSDSGTVPEECCIKRVPNLTLRKATERIEILEHAGSILVGSSDKESIVKGADLMLKSKLDWQIPSDYLVSDSSHRVMSLILSKINK
ncbi:non-hydrolyzing UDP-N-acetylglucosamine 2-epimerase [Pseudomonadota bacterium]